MPIVEPSAKRAYQARVEIPHEVLEANFRKKADRQKVADFLMESAPFHSYDAVTHTLQYRVPFGHLIPVMYGIPEKLYDTVHGLSKQMSWYYWRHSSYGKQFDRYVARYVFTQNEREFIVYRQGDNKGTSNYVFVSCHHRLAMHLQTQDQIRTATRLLALEAEVAPLHINDSCPRIQGIATQILANGGTYGS